MARTTQEVEAFGSDSFLDVVTNIVGILIILVMAVGIHIQKSPANTVADETVSKADVESLAREATSLEHDMLGLEDQVRAVSLTAQARYQERGTLAYLLAEHEREIDEAKKSLDAQSRSLFDMQRALSAAERESQQLEQAKAQASQIKKRKPIQIKSYPTPISHTVYGNEVHFQLRNGRLTLVPLVELAQLADEDAHRRNSSGVMTDTFTGTVGPLEGFTAEYIVELIPGRLHARFTVFLQPVDENLGEPVDEALQEFSRFRTRLSELRPRQTTITLWTYPESFVDYTRLKEVLYNLGFSVAGRPMKADMPIGGSNEGSRSAAQ